MLVPRHGSPSDPQKERLAAFDHQILNLAGPRIARLAQHEHSAIGVREKWLERIATQVWIDRYCVGT